MSEIQQIARKHDNDRYLCCLFAPPAEREALFALLAFNHEVARVSSTVSEEMLGLIRLTWWREAIQEIAESTPPRNHEVVKPLFEAFHKYHLTQDYFTRILTAREADLQQTPFTLTEDLEHYAEETSSTLLMLWLEILGAKEEVLTHVAKHLGVAWALLGIIRSLPHTLSNNHCLLPKELLAKQNLTPEMLLQGGHATPPLEPIIQEIHALAMQHLNELKKFKADMCKTVLPLCLLQITAHHYANEIRSNKFRLGKRQYSPTWLHIKLLLRGIFA